MSEPIREHLRLLSTFHYVVGGIGCLFSLFPCIHLAMGIFFLVAPEEMFQPPPAPAVAGEAGEAAPPAPATPPFPSDAFPVRLFGALFTAIPALLIVAGLAFSSCVILAGRRLAALRSYRFCLVMAGVECIFMPFGTVLGVFTILTLIKPEAKALFGENSPGGSAVAA